MTTIKDIDGLLSRHLRDDELPNLGQFKDYFIITLQEAMDHPEVFNATRIRRSVLKHDTLWDVTLRQSLEELLAWVDDQSKVFALVRLLATRREGFDRAMDLETLLRRAIRVKNSAHA